MPKFNSFLQAICFSMIFLFNINSIGASFDCSNAKQQDEIAICSNQQLSNLDEQLGNIYQKIIKTLPADSAHEFKLSQLNWLQKRKSICGGDTTCLLQMLQERLSFLSTYITENVSPQNTNTVDTQSTNATSLDTTKSTEEIKQQNNEMPKAVISNNKQQEANHHAKQFISKNDAITVIILFVFGVLAFVVAGIGLHSFMKNKHNYNVFSLINIALSVLSCCSIILTIIFFNTHYTNLKIALPIFTLLILGILFYIIMKKSNWYMSLISVFYLLLANILLAILWLIWSMTPGSGNKQREKERLKRLNKRFM